MNCFRVDFPLKTERAGALNCAIYYKMYLGICRHEFSILDDIFGVLKFDDTQCTSMYNVQYNVKVVKLI